MASKIAGAGTQHTSALATKLRKDVEDALIEEFGTNPKLVKEIEGVLEKVADVAIEDVAGAIHNPIVRMLVKTAIHSMIDKAFEATTGE